MSCAFVFSSMMEMFYNCLAQCGICIVTLSCLTVCDPMESSIPGFPVHHQLLEFTQTHVHWIGDAIQPSHPLLSPTPPAFSLSQHHSLSGESPLHFKWPNYWSFSISPSNKYSGLISLGLTGLISLLPKGLSRVFSSTTVRKHQFFSTQSSLLSSSHIRTWLLEKIQLWRYRPLSESNDSAF